jgi:hypothetical protein
MSYYTFLTVKTLLDIIRVRNLRPPSNLKADLIASLLQADNMTDTQEISDLRKEVADLQALVGQQSQQLALHAGLQQQVQALTIQLQASQQPGPLSVVPQVPIPGAQPPIGRPPDVNKQGDKESVRMFLTRLEGYLAVCNITTEDRKLQYLFSAANSQTASFVAEQVQSGCTNFNTIKQAVIQRFEPSVFIHAQQFRTMTKRSDENFLDFGHRLRQSFLASIGKSEGDITPDHELIITQNLLNQLLSTISSGAQDHLNNFLLVNQQASWTQTITCLEVFAASRRSNQRPATNNKQPAGGRRGARTGVCYNCGSPDHYADQCPSPSKNGQRHNQGNSTAGAR